MQYTETELAQLIEKVEKAFTADIAKAEDLKAAELAKSEEASDSVAQPTKTLAKGEEAEGKEEKKDEKAEEHKEESKEEPKEESKEAPKEAAAEESKEESEEAHKEESAEHKADDEDHSGYDDEDMEQMHKMYRSMSKGELKAHHDSVRKALDGHNMDKCGDITMSKSEENTSVEVTPEVTEPKVENKEMELLKAEVEASKAKAESLQKNLDAVTEFLTKFVKKSVPQGKAITSLDVVHKSEESNEGEDITLSKGEITAILKTKSADPTLAKSDRDAINAYYLNGASINTISHLLKK